ncbi:sensor domain-containing protein [Rhizobium sp. CFBP 8762]|uniref:sensor domain-containing protein n=1 Tax=Rhizobium sp. CFBP 8762 TaxID=2775279 RepID=UPI001A7E4B81|nr:diguanylate cyclase [Rhizobium sp. CFBP 8762]
MGMNDNEGPVEAVPSSSGGVQTGAVPGPDVLFASAPLLDRLPALVAYINREYRFVYANKAYAAWRDKTPEEVIGQHCRDVVGNANFTLVGRRLRQALAGKAVSYDYAVLQNGRKRRVHACYLPHTGADGVVVGVFAMLTDISSDEGGLLPLTGNDALFEDTFLNAPIGMAVVETTGRVARVNESFAAMLGCDPVALEGVDFRDITHADDRDADVLLFKQVLAGLRDGYRIEKRYINFTGNVVETILSVSAVRDDTGEPICFVSQIEDVTEQRAAERRLRENNAQLSLAIDAVQGGFWHMDVATGEFTTSQQLARFIAGPDASVFNLQGYMKKINPEDYGATNLLPLLSGQVDRSSDEYRLETVNGSRWMRCDRRLLRDAKGDPQLIVGMTTDISDERQRLIQSEEEADTDSLTGLLNRRGFTRRVQKGAKGRTCGILAIDLDSFKEVNDRLGHKAGDLVLIEVANRLRSCVRTGDMIARLGGDEFAVFLMDAGRDHLRSLAQRVVATLHEPYRIGIADLALSGSVGASWTASWNGDLDTFLAHADTVLYEAKAAGKDNWQMDHDSIESE